MNKDVASRKKAYNIFIGFGGRIFSLFRGKFIVSGILRVFRKKVEKGFGIIGCRYCFAAVLETVPERQDRMVQVVGRNFQIAEIQLGLLKMVIADVRTEF